MKPIKVVQHLRRNRYVKLFIACFFGLFATGVTLGWMGFALLLDFEGVYFELCPDDEPFCSARIVRLNLLYTVGISGIMVSTVFNGFVLDFFGPRVSCIVAALLMLVGDLLLAFADFLPFDAYLPGWFLLAFGGPGVLLTLLQFGSLFPRWRTVIVSFISAEFGSAAFIMVFFQYLHVWFGFSLRQLMLGYSLVFICLVFAAIFFFPGKDRRYRKNVSAEAEIPEESEEELLSAGGYGGMEGQVEDSEMDECDVRSDASWSTTTSTRSIVRSIIGPIERAVIDQPSPMAIPSVPLAIPLRLVLGDAEQGKSSVVRSPKIVPFDLRLAEVQSDKSEGYSYGAPSSVGSSRDRFEGVELLPPQSLRWAVIENDINEIPEDTAPEVDVLVPEVVHEIRKAETPMVEQSFFRLLFSVDYFLLICWVSFHSLRFSYFLGTFPDRMRWYSSVEEAERWTAWFGIVVSCGMFFGPFVGLILKFGCWVGFGGCGVLLLLMSVCTVIPIKSVQIFGGLVYLFACNFMWPAIFSYLQIYFGRGHFGKLEGLNSFVAAIIGTIQLFFVYATVTWLQGSFLLIDAALLVIAIPVELFAIRAWRVEKNQKQLLMSQ